jgi:phage gp29-like protein
MKKAAKSSMSPTPARKGAKGATPQEAAPGVAGTPNDPAPDVLTVPMRSPAPKKKQQLQRGGSSAGAPGQAVTLANRWRENYNPFRQLGIRRAVDLLEMGQRGDTALLQWTYRKLERCYPTLSGLLSRCEAPLLNYQWSVKIKSQLPPGATPEMAKAQQVSLRSAYESLDNLKQAVMHAHMAFFRGYAHMQKHRSTDGEVTHLECLDQWLVCRDGVYGDWWWNPDSIFTTSPAMALGESNRIGGDILAAEDFMIFEAARPVNEVALITFVRWNLCNKDWDAFIEIYGIPGGVVEMPPNVPEQKEKEYEAAAKGVAEGGSGAVPNGSKYFPNDHPRGVDPFTPRIKVLDEDLVLAGTGGKMGILTAHSGLGGGNQGKQHDQNFQEIAQGRAGEISEMFQTQFDLEVLDREHPGEPVLVYFELSPKDNVDVDGLVKNIVSLASVGKSADVDWLNEQTGYQLEDKPLEKVDVKAMDTVGGKNPEQQAEKTGEQLEQQQVNNRMAAALERLADCGESEFEREFALLNREFPALGRMLAGRGTR